MSYFVRVLEYPASARCARRFRRCNPSASSDKPIVRVINIGPKKGARVDTGKFADLGFPGPDANGVDEEFSKEFDKLVDALEYKANLIEDFRNENWMVLNFPDSEKYCVYVIRLDESARYSRKLKRNNPGMDHELPMFYVGQTSKAPEERYEEHTKADNYGDKASDLGSSFVFEYASRDDDALVKEIYGDWNTEPMTLLESLMAERELAMQLRKLGYGVYYA